MGGEKRSSKGGPGGFRSKWKKLFSGKSTSAEQNQDGLDEEKLEFESHMMEDEKRSECSCVSSLSIDEEGAGVKAPNVVARLMGLESLPSADLIESGSTPFYACKPTRGPKKSLQFGPQYLSFHSARQPTGVEAFSGKMMEASPQKLQKLAKMGRFQTETLPMKPVKSYSDIQHKLLSPIKSSGFVSAKSAAHLMETAVKILEPRLHPPAKNKSSIIGSSSISLNDRGQVEDRASSYRICKPLEIPKKLCESNAVKCLKGQAMNKSWNGPEDGPSSRVSSERRLLKDLSPSLLGQSTVESNQKLSFSSVKKERQVVLPQDCPNTTDNKPASARVQGKSVSLAIQAKVNVQKRENCSSSGHPNSSTATSLLVQDEQDEPALSRQRKNQLHLQKNKQKQATSGATNVLRQNNQKQNRLPKPGDQLARRDVGGNISSRQKLANPEGGRNCTVSGRTNSCSQTGKVGSLRASERCVDKRDVEKGSCPKGTSDFPRKKRLIEGIFSSDKKGLVETTFINGDKSKTNQEAEVTNSFLNQADFKRQSLQTVEQAVSSSDKGTDVVSFTFTSPLAAISRCRPSGEALDRQDKKKSCFRDSYGGKNDSSTKCSMLLEGDALSALLERKLRELTSGIQNADGFKIANSGSANTLSILQDFLFTLNSGGGILKEHDAESSSAPQESNLNHVHIARADKTSSSSQTVKKDLRFQVKEAEEHLGTQREHLLKVDPADEKEHLSPVSIFEAAYSNDSCNSFDSTDVVYGGPLDHSCQAFKSPLMRTDKELLDSASSVCTAVREKPGFSRVQLQRSDVCPNEQELEYVRDIISNTRLIFEEIAVGMPNEVVDPVLFKKLESNCSTSGSAEDQKQMKIERKLWFDCVTECANSKYGQYSKGDCRNWTKGAAVIGRTGLAEDIFKEMLGWRSMGELKVDEILDKDMSTGPGRWIDFQNEEFEAGMEIEADIFDSLIEEVAIYTFGLEI